MNFDVVRKSFEINIRTKRRFYKKEIKVKYEQASMYEIMEFLYESQQKGFMNANWIVDFVENHTKTKLNNFDRRIVVVKSQTIFDTLQNTYFKGAFEEEKVDIGDGEVSNGLISSYVVFLSGELKQDPLYLMKNYTIEQLKFFTDGLSWNMNEKTPEGQKRNRLKLVAQRSKNISNDGVQNLLSKINENRCNEVYK